MRAARMFRHLAASIGRRELAATCRECPMFRRAPPYRVRADTYSPVERNRLTPAGVEGGGQEPGAGGDRMPFAAPLDAWRAAQGRRRAARLGGAQGGVKVLPASQTTDTANDAISRNSIGFSTMNRETTP